MIFMSFIFAVIGVPQDAPKREYKPAVYARALGRPLAWDRYGAYALDAQGPLPKEDADLVEQVMLGELGRAEARARARMAKAGDDMVPPWILGQILRVRRAALAVYEGDVRERVDAPASPAILFYRYEVCRLAYDAEVHAPKRPDQATFERTRGEMGRLRARLLPFSRRSLGLTIGLTQAGMWMKVVSSSRIAPWGPVNRAVLEAYWADNPKGVDVRPLLCQTYNTGVIYGLSTFPDGHRERLFRPDEPQPRRALEIARSILKDRPDDPLGHFCAGRSDAILNQGELATKELRKAIATGKLPPFYETAARRYLETGSQNAFRPTVPY